jgi:hypothetical protein
MTTPEKRAEILAALAAQQIYGSVVDLCPDGARLKGLCPFHVEKTPSFFVYGDKSFHCFGCGKHGSAFDFMMEIHGCDFPHAVSYLEGMVTNSPSNNARLAPKPVVVTEYDYTDEHGTLLFQVLRLDPKGFRQRKPDGSGGFIFNLSGVRRVLYRLPDVGAANEVLVLEGEKDCDNGRKLGVVATCNPGGAGKWKPEYSEVLRGKTVTIIADADEPGRKHAQQVATGLHLIAASTKVLELPGAKDLSEWVERGGTREALQELIRDAPAWQPEVRANHGFNLMSLSDLLARPDVPVEYVVEGHLVAGTVAAIVAKPKVGKSTFARQLCLCVSRGENFLGLKTKQGECIYLALEEREQDVKKDFRAMGADGTEPILIHAASAPAEGIRALCDLVRARQSRLVVIDPLFRLARIKDEKAYAETYAALGLLIDIAREVGTLIVVTHHAGKNAKSDPIDSPLGSTALGGIVSTLIVLKRADSIRTAQTVQRVGEDLPETVLEFDPDTKLATLGPGKTQLVREGAKELILSYLESADETKTEPEIMAAVEGTNSVKRKALRDLVAGGAVNRGGGGKRNDPFTYRFSYCRTPDMLRTSVPEIQNATEPLQNNDYILVRENAPSSGSELAGPADPEQLFRDSQARFGGASARLFPFIGKSVLTPRGKARLETAYECGCETVLDSEPGHVVVFRADEIVANDTEDD